MIEVARTPKEINQNINNNNQALLDALVATEAIEPESEVKKCFFCILETLEILDSPRDSNIDSLTLNSTEHVF